MSQIIKGLAIVLQERPRHEQLKGALKALDIRYEDVCEAKGLNLGYLKHILNGRQPSEAYLSAVEEYISEVLNQPEAA